MHVKYLKSILFISRKDTNQEEEIQKILNYFHFGTTGDSTIPAAIFNGNSNRII
jgi:hypothetical protein